MNSTSTPSQQLDEEEQPLNFSTNSDKEKSLAAYTKIPCLLDNYPLITYPPPPPPPSIFISNGLAQASYMSSFATAAAMSVAMNAASQRQLQQSISPIGVTKSEISGTSTSSLCSFSLAQQRSLAVPLTLTCSVCGDVSSGKHYGILACNGCSGFFKRSVRRRLIYRCQAGTGMCMVDKTHRNQCQACRLKKCIDKGMNKDAVQNERQPRNVTGIHSCVEQDFSCSTSSATKSSFFIQEYTGKIGGTAGEIPDSTSAVVKCTSPTERTKPNEKEENEFNEIRVLENESVHETAAKVLFMAIKWVKNLPSFTCLSFRDQIVLIEEGWCDLFLLSFYQWSFSIDKCPQLNKLRTISPNGLRHLQAIFTRIRKYNLDQTEFACLKALALFAPDARGLRNSSQVEELQDDTQQLLSHHSTLRGVTRFGRLLLILPLLRTIRAEKIDEAFFALTFGSTPVEKMICKIYKG